MKSTKIVLRRLEVAMKREAGDSVYVALVCESCGCLAFVLASVACMSDLEDNVEACIELSLHEGIGLVLRAWFEYGDGN